VKYKGLVEAPQGERFRLTGRASPLAALCGELIGRRVAHALRAQCRQRLRAGEALDFGPFRLAQDCLYHGGERLPWPEVAAVERREGEIAVSPNDDGPPISVPSWQVPRAELFLALAGEFVARHEAGRPPAPRPSRRPMA
jgi:hypothetical protein